MTNWFEADNKLSKTFKFEDFTAAFSFMTKLALYAEQANHHPLWTNVYNQVVIELTTHDAGNIVTDKDRKFAAIADEAYRIFGQ